MKNGFKEVVDKILRSYGLKTTSDCIGAVWSEGNFMYAVLRTMGYRVEDGINNPPYDYVIMSSKKSTLPNILEALTKIKTGTIIIFRVTSVELSNVLMDMNKLKCGLKASFWGYGGDKILGVIFKGKKD